MHYSVDYILRVLYPLLFFFANFTSCIMKGVDTMETFLMTILIIFILGVLAIGGMFLGLGQLVWKAIQKFVRWLSQ